MADPTDERGKHNGGRDVFKVTTQREHRNGAILKLEGRLAAAWVDEFTRTFDAVMREHGKVTLDLEGLSFADAAGVAFLRGAVERGARLVGVSEFIGALIDEVRP
jgi:anti-anti-sigma regulatory factor